MTFFSYAQNFEDVLLWRALGHIGNGFYIDLGAAHPDSESVTRAFHERGWSGINVEPLWEQFRRLERARPRDINLRLAVGEAPGTARFFVVNETGLSTLDRDLAESHRDRFGIKTTIEVPVDTLAAICRRHVRSDIHFLKIDVEGSERAALAGADFDAFRPWIVLVEATQPTRTIESHAEWEPLLIAADYRFVWFDGLNRFYVAAERHGALSPHFRAPPNVFDDFVRAADSEWVPRVHEIEARNAALSEQWREAQSRLGSANAELARLREELAPLGRLREEAAEAARVREEVARLNERLAAATARGEVAERWMREMRASTSWRITSPIRGFKGFLAGRRPEPEPELPALADLGAAPRLDEVGGEGPGNPDGSVSEYSNPPPEVPVGRLPDQSWPPDHVQGTMRRAVHQFHSGSARGDAITNAMLLCRDLLRSRGYRSEIFVEWIDPELGDEVRPLAELPRHDGYVLIVRHSSGYGAFDHVRALPARKVLIYHNITPPDLMPPAQRYFAQLGRAQLAQWRGHVAAVLADSEFNAIELRALGFEEARACALLFDLDALRARADAAPVPCGRAARIGATETMFTLLFVGRITPSKAQDQLIEAFAAFRQRFAAPSRLVLVGREDSANAGYARTLQSRIRSLGLDGHVVLTGLIPDAERDAWYGHADLYVSLSRHEGFGVPLVEAAAHGLPVVAVADGAVPYTLGDVPGAILADRSPGAVAEVLLALANDPAARAGLAERQRRHLDRFRIAQQMPKLLHALALAGAAPPADPDGRALLAANLSLTVTGHVNGSYSLAVVNRTLAAALEAARPGRVRVAPVEGRPTTDLSGVPAEERDAVALLAGRPAPTSGPHVVISQHYPVYARPPSGDAMLALFFWEESLIPPATIAVLNGGFRGVLAPSRSVAKALLDSGLSIPVHVVGYAPALADFLVLGDDRRDGKRARSPDAPFTFLHVSSCFPRKGIDILLTAWAGAFRRGDKARLVIKGFPNPHNDVDQRIDALRRTNPDLAGIEYIGGDLSRAEMRDLYRDADAMVLPSRGEGFNIPAAEAMAAGVPLLVTDGGGHRDFCHEDNATLIGYRFAASRSHLAEPLSLWMEPDADDLARKLRTVLEDRESDGAIARKAGQAHRDARTLADPLPWAHRIAEAALDALLAPPRAPIRIAWVSTWDVRCGVAEYSRTLLEAMPSGPEVAGITVLCDARTGATPAERGLRARPAWRVGAAGSMADLAEAVAREDADIVVVQHQPGLIAWDALADLLGRHALASRRVVVTLHSTHHLLDIAPEQRRAALQALGGVARVLVHTVGDMNLLKDEGLSANVALMPHGTRTPRRPRAARPLTPASAPLIGCYGFLLPGKGIPELIAALSLVRERFPRARLRLVNADYGAPESTAEIEACRRAAAARGLEDAVDFRTEFLAHDASLDLLAECDVVALPYQASRESSSAALRTALCAGVPVAVTPLALFDEAGDAVARLPGLGAASLATGLADLLADAERRMAIQVAAGQWLAERDGTRVAAWLRNMLLGLTAAPADSLPRREADPMAETEDGGESRHAWNA